MKTRYASIDTIKGIAAIFVILIHAKFGGGVRRIHSAVWILGCAVFLYGFGLLCLW